MPMPWETNWILGPQLGVGGQGITFAVTGTRAEMPKGALKKLKNNKDAQARARMHREVANLQALALAGGNVPQVLDHNTEDLKSSNSQLFVVMEFVEGQTLREFVEARGVLSLDEALAAVISICKTIDIAHGVPIVHRDLKPENIIVRRGDLNDLVIVDFGLSFNTANESITEVHETFRNRFLDLPETNTPNGERRDHRSDLTAVCALLYFCITGNNVGQLQDGSGLLPHHRPGLSIPIPGVQDTRLGILDRLLLKGFAPSLANRFQSIAELIDALKELKTAASEYDSANPVHVATALSSRLRLNHLKTRIASRQPSAQQLISHLQGVIQRFHAELGEFTLSSMHVGTPEALTLAAGEDLVETGCLTAILKAAHHYTFCHRQYSVILRGTECVLKGSSFRSTSMMTRQRRADVLWSDIATFSDRPESVFDLATADFERWLSTSMEDLYAEALASPNPPQQERSRGFLDLS